MLSHLFKMPGKSIYLYSTSWSLRLTSVSCIIISFYFLFSAKDFPAGGNIFPIFSTGASIVLALILMASTFIKSNADKSKNFYLNINYNTFKPPLLIVLSILYIIGITEIGYFVSSIAFLYITTYAVGIRNLKAITITGIILFPTMYGFFVFLLHAQLPRGILF